MTDPSWVKQWLETTIAKELRNTNVSVLCPVTVKIARQDFECFLRVKWNAFNRKFYDQVMVSGKSEEFKMFLKCWASEWSSQWNQHIKIVNEEKELPATREVGHIPEIGSPARRDIKEIAIRTAINSNLWCGVRKLVGDVIMLKLATYSNKRETMSESQWTMFILEETRKEMKTLAETSGTLIWMLLPALPERNGERKP